LCLIGDLRRIRGLYENAEYNWVVVFLNGNLADPLDVPADSGMNYAVFSFGRQKM
jgi:hypothetical protein